MRARLLVLLLAPGSWLSAEDSSGRQVAFGLKVAEKGLWQEARFRFERAVELDPGNAAALNDLAVALENSRLDQTLNTPALTTLFLLDDTVAWMLEHGGLEWAASRCDLSAATLLGWAAASEFAVAMPRPSWPWNDATTPASSGTRANVSRNIAPT